MAHAGADLGRLHDVPPECAGAWIIPQATLRRWTRAEYNRLVELGVFENGERLELIDGFLVLREPQGTRHATGIRRVVAALRRALGPDWQIDSQLPLALDASSEPEPDVSVVPGDAGTYRDAHPSRPLLVVEVADSSYGSITTTAILGEATPRRTAGATETSKRFVLHRRSHPPRANHAIAVADLLP